MNRRKTAVVMLAAVLAVGGCARNGGPEGTVTANAGAEHPDAAAALDAATGELLKDTFRVTVAFGGAVRVKGVADPRTGAAELVLETGGPAGPGSTVLRMIGGVTYAKIDMEDAGGRPALDGTKWIRLDKDRSPGGPIDSFIDFDIRRFIGASDSLTDVQWVDDDTVRGFIDASEARQATGLAGAATGAPIGTVPFESDIEPGGRLARFAYTAKVLTTEPEIDFEMAYSDFGLPVQVATPPAADILTP